MDLDNLCTFLWSAYIPKFESVREFSKQTTAIVVYAI